MHIKKDRVRITAAIRSLLNGKYLRIISLSIPHAEILQFILSTFLLCVDKRLGIVYQKGYMSRVQAESGRIPRI